MHIDPLILLTGFELFELGKFKVVTAFLGPALELLREALPLELIDQGSIQGGNEPVRELLLLIAVTIGCGRVLPVVVPSLRLERKK